MKKLSKLVFKGKADFLNEKEMKNILGGYSGGGANAYPPDTCQADQSACMGTCYPTNGKTRICKKHYTSEGVPTGVCSCVTF